MIQDNIFSSLKVSPYITLALIVAVVSVLLNDRFHLWRWKKKHPNFSLILLKNGSQAGSSRRLHIVKVDGKRVDNRLDVGMLRGDKFYIEGGKHNIEFVVTENVTMGALKRSVRQMKYKTSMMVNCERGGQVSVSVTAEEKDGSTNYTIECQAPLKKS